MIVRSKDDFEVLDEDELEDAFHKNEITKEQFNRAYEILNFLKSSFLSNIDRYKELADKYYKFLQK
jgi:predicted RNA-binding protein associated with RNAse of E/G family